MPEEQGDLSWVGYFRNIPDVNAGIRNPSRRLPKEEIRTYESQEATESEH